jgi:hypothetical protein
MGQAPSLLMLSEALGDTMRDLLWLIVVGVALTCAYSCGRAAISHTAIRRAAHQARQTAEADASDEAARGIAQIEAYLAVLSSH